MYYPTLEEAKVIVKQGDYDIIPISKEIYGDMLTPIEVMRILKNNSEHAYMLESVDDTKRWSRYTFMGFDPKSEITCFNHMMNVDGKQFYVDHPRDYIRELLSHYKSPRLSQLPSFTGGLVGYFAYDYLKYSEPILDKDVEDEDGFNDVDLMLFDFVICFDNLKQKIILIENIKTDDLENNYPKGIEKINQVQHLLMEGKKAIIEPLQIEDDFQPLFSKEQFCQMVSKAKDYIKKGDIFQVVLSNRLSAKATGSLFDTYRILRTINPSPYMFYFSSDRQEIAGASPETLVKLEDQNLYTFPLAGTRARGKDDEEDEMLINDLLSDEKELAEHNMLVDLGRNDIGRIAKLGSVKVEKYMEILKFSRVMHIGSTVKGTIKEDCDALSAIDALLPAGTLSGAPKIRACQIIDELEGTRRGLYGGAIGYIDFTGNLDTCIAIRLAYKRNNKVFACSGAGIVYDSVPEKEYQECLNKAAAVVKALHVALGGIDE